MKQDRLQPGSILTLMLALALAGSTAMTLQAQPQITAAQLATLTPLDSTNSFTPGNYWFLVGPDPGRPYPPLPMPPRDVQGAPIYDLGGRNFLIDDSQIDWAALRQQREMNSALDSLEAQSGLSANPAAGGVLRPMGLNSYTEDDLYLLPPVVTNNTALIVIHPPAAEAANGVYDLFMTTNLSSSGDGLNLTNWLWLLRTDPGQTNLVLWNLWADEAFFLLARTNDSDGDGMSDAYEVLVSHTDPNVPDGPQILSQPLSQDVLEQDTITFSVVAFGGGTLAYQWTCNGTNLAGATGSSYTIASVQMGDAGAYAVTVTNSVGSVSSQTAELTVEWGTYNPLLMYLKGARQDYTFKPGVSYCLGSDGPVELYGTTRLMGGSVLRFDWSTNSSLVIKGSLICDTQPFLPCVLTSRDDDSQGDHLWYRYPDSWPQPHAGAGPYLDLTFAQSADIHDVRICFADIGMTTPASSGRLDIWDCQFVQCNTGITNAVGDFGAIDSLHNVLFAQCGTAIAATTNSIRIEGEHVTADVSNFFSGPSPANEIALTNSIILGTLGDAAIVSTPHVALILVRVQAETNNPRPCTDASHSLSVRGQPRQAHFQGPHYPGHV